MEALKIVCNHKDIKQISELKIIKEKQKRFENYLSDLHNVMDDILWVTRRPETREDFYNNDADYDHISNEEKDRLWEKCLNIRDKYPPMFSQITHLPAEAEDEDEDFDEFVKTIRNEGRLDGVIGCIRSLLTVQENIFHGDYLCKITCENDNDEACRCDTIIDDEFNDITTLNLDLDS